MAVGRNLAYKKELFFEANGFMKHMKIRSGDDDLFINQVATKKNTAICVYLKESFTASIPKKSFKSWILQKRRHVSTASHYKPLHKFLLSSILLVPNYLFWILGIVLIAMSCINGKSVLGLFLLRFALFRYVDLLYASCNKT